MYFIRPCGEGEQKSRRRSAGGVALQRMTAVVHGGTIGAWLVTRAKRSLRSDEVEHFWVDFDFDVLVLVEQRGVVHLPGDGALAAGRRIFELEHFDGLRAEWLRDGHAGLADGSVGEDFDARPPAWEEVGLY